MKDLSLYIIVGGILLMLGRCVVGTVSRINDMHRPLFENGDCIQRQLPDKEEWEDRPSINRIIAIGKKSYRCEFFSKEHKEWLLSSYYPIFSQQRHYEKVECPK
jgi:hypothetical protein